MKCKKCGKKLKKSEKFCIECGYYNGDNNENMLFNSNDSLLDEEESNFFSDIPIEDNTKKSNKGLSENLNENLDYIDDEDDDNDYDFDDIDNSNKKKYDDIDNNFDKMQEQVKNDNKRIKSIQEDFINKSNKDKNFYGEDEDLIESYIGEDYKVIKKMPFNIYATIFNWLYFLYRKLYITGIIGLVITLLLIAFARDYIIIYIIITMVLQGFVFNKYYIFICKKRINKIKIEYEGSDRFNLNSICEEKGGVNSIPALIIYLVFLVITVLIIAPFNITVPEKQSKFFSENSETLATCTSLSKIAYEEAKKNENYDITEAVCKKGVADDDYKIYLKATNKSSNTLIYLYYKTEKEYIMFETNTEGKNELLTKEANGKITDEEQEKLNKMLKIEKSYSEIYKKSQKEDELIKKHEDNEPKSNYVFGKSELYR